GSDFQTVPAPTAVSDNCGEATLIGRFISLNGSPLDVAIEVSSSGNLLEQPGRYEVEWVATDAAGNSSDPVIQTVDSEACVAAGASLRVQNGAALTYDDGSPMA